MDTKDLEEIFQISPIIPSPFDGGGYGWGRTKAIVVPLPFTLLDKIVYSALLFKKSSI